MKDQKLILKSKNAIYLIQHKSKIKVYFIGIGLILALFLFLPWTQNIRTHGTVTTLKQEQRPQKLNALIPGKISSWHVKEGDFVTEGDTILILSEIKEDYLDPNLIHTTQLQKEAKKSSIDFYNNKVTATKGQISNLNAARNLKLDQLNNKLTQISQKLAAEKAELVANENEVLLLKNQFERQQKMFDEGLVSQTQLQQRNIQYQNALAKQTITMNKIFQTQQEINNIQIEKEASIQDYSEKINKAQSDKFQNLSFLANTEGEIAKIENQLSNYKIRNNRYVVTAPQKGQIVQANKAGIGEILKEGEPIAYIVPDQIDFAVEIFVNATDLPLINVGQTVRLTFDGFPAIVFSGWPKASYGTFGANIVAIENAIGQNGKYRVLAAEDKRFKPWPEQLRIGVGTNSIVFCKEVPIWYELWRNINGFPPDYYEKNNQSKTQSK
ncbi:MAG TPA: HlyD family efflux transporter periplasmic adaptor subunit [Saprospiraceae bacterium]|nr:HlyD family efflux transporter periplasmic adaptor subunit [Saprospiraceae bacterium]